LHYALAVRHCQEELVAGEQKEGLCIAIKAMENGIIAS
jgi:hypothetical protein